MKRVIVLERLGPGKYSVLYWLAVPATRQPFYAKPGAVSAWPGASSPESTAIASGAVHEVMETLSKEGMPNMAAVQAETEIRWQVLQDEINSNGANQWNRYGSYWDSVTGWTSGGVS
jgi:hypothetical protein